MMVFIWNRPGPCTRSLNTTAEDPSSSDRCLKGQSHEIFRHYFFCLKDSIWAKIFDRKVRKSCVRVVVVYAEIRLENFSFSRRCSRKFAKNDCICSRWLRGQANFKHWNGISSQKRKSTQNCFCPGRTF